MHRDDYIPEVKEVTVRLGDTWQLGEHTLICDNAFESSVIQKIIKIKEPDILFTDPPWGVDDKMSYDSERFFHPQRLLDLIPNTKSYLWGAQNYIHLVDNYSEGSWFVWDKGNQEFELCWSNSQHRDLIVKSLWQNPDDKALTENGKLLTHPTQKPVQLTSFFLGTTTETVMDPFLGSGTTLIACEKNGQKCIAIEIDPYFCQMAINRYEQYSGKSAVKCK